jgi:hypothetical protein
MATQMVSGFGEIQLRDNINNVLYMGGFATIELTDKTDSVDAERYDTLGNLIISDSYQSRQTYELKLVQQVSDSLGDGLALGEIPSVVSTASYYDYVETIVPTAAPYEIPFTGVTTVLGNAASVCVTMMQSGTWNSYLTGQKNLNLKSVATTPTDGEFQVVTTTVGSEKIVFNAAQAKAPVIISYLKTVTGKLSVGLSPASTVKRSGSMFFSAKLMSDEYPNGAILMMPSVTKVSGMKLKSGAVSPLEHTFKVGTAGGYRAPIAIIYL